MKFLGIGVLVFVFALTSAPAFAQKGDAKAGKALFTKNCVACHGAEGEGKDAIAKLMKVEMRRLGSKEAQAHTDEELRTIVLEGNGKMKPVKGITEKDLPNLIAYFRTLPAK